MTERLTVGMVALAALAALAACSSVQADETVLMYDGDLSGWQELSNDDGAPLASVEVVEEAGVGKVLDAVAAGSNSSYSYDKVMPFSEDAVLSLKYKVLEAANDRDERTMAGNDFALKVWLIPNDCDPPYKALILVHSSQHPAGEGWQMLTISDETRFEVLAISDADQEGEWIEQDIHVGRLWQDAFGSLPEEMAGFVFSVDGDNAHGRMHSRIARISYTPG